MSVLAPEGTAWMNIMNDFNRELKEKTQGELEFKIYAGGVSGDETDVIRKMRSGQIHAGGFTGVGLGQILPEIRILELPFIFQNYNEVDHIHQELGVYFKEQFKSKGYVFLGFAEAGFVNIFSSKPLKTQADLKSAKMWAWEGDVLVKELCAAYKIVPVTLSIADVLTSLQTGLIDSFYAPPLGAIALQWFTKVKYMTEPQLTNSTGGVVVSKKIFDTIPEKNQKILQELANKHLRALITNTREGNQKSYETLKKQGIKFVTVSSDELEKMKITSKQVQQKLTGTLYSKSLLDRLNTALESYRKGENKTPEKKSKKNKKS